MSLSTLESNISINHAGVGVYGTNKQMRANQDHSLISLHKQKEAVTSNKLVQLTEKLYKNAEETIDRQINKENEEARKIIAERNENIIKNPIRRVAPGIEKHGSTATSLLASGGNMVAAHLGDSHIIAVNTKEKAGSKALEFKRLTGPSHGGANQEEMTRVRGEGGKIDMYGSEPRLRKGARYGSSSIAVYRSFGDCMMHGNGTQEEIPGYSSEPEIKTYTKEQLKELKDEGYDYIIACSDGFLDGCTNANGSESYEHDTEQFGEIPFTQPPEAGASPKEVVAYLSSAAKTRVDAGNSSTADDMSLIAIKIDDIINMDPEIVLGMNVFDGHASYPKDTVTDNDREELNHCSKEVANSFRVTLERELNDELLCEQTSITNQYESILEKIKELEDTNNLSLDITDTDNLQSPQQIVEKIYDNDTNTPKIEIIEETITEIYGRYTPKIEIVEDLLRADQGQYNLSYIYLIKKLYAEAKAEAENEQNPRDDRLEKIKSQIKIKIVDNSIVQEKISGEAEKLKKATQTKMNESQFCFLTTYYACVKNPEQDKSTSFKLYACESFLSKAIDKTTDGSKKGKMVNLLERFALIETNPQDAKTTFLQALRILSHRKGPRRHWGHLSDPKKAKSYEENESLINTTAKLLDISGNEINAAVYGKEASASCFGLFSSAQNMPNNVTTYKKFSQVQNSLERDEQARNINPH